MKPYVLYLALLSGPAIQAQTIFIPDATMRGWLNAAKPGGVDVNGYCDTAAWNQQGLSTLTLNAAGLADGTTVDLEGMQYLRIYKVILQGAPPNTVYMQWPGYPQSMQQLHLVNMDVGAISGPLFPLSDQLEEFKCKSCGLQSIPAFSGYNMIFQNEDLSGGGLVVPDSVTWLEMSYCSLTAIPTMPNVTHLNVDNNFMTITDWTNLPASLEYLSAAHVGNGLPNTLPPGLVVLNIPANYPTSLPPLPSTLVHLTVSFNSLTSLPLLPAGLEELSVDYGALTAVPPLPAGIRMLNVGGNAGIASLPALSGFSDLKVLYVHQTGIGEVPPLPDGLLVLDVYQCTQLTCLPVLPSTLLSLDVEGSGVTCFPNLPAGIVGNDLGIPPLLCNAVNTLCPLADPLISGTTFHDADANGTLDFGELPRPNGLVIAQPGDLLAGSDMNGRYVVPADIGSYTMEGVPGLYHPVTTPATAITFTGLGEVDSLNHVGFSSVPGIYDLVVTMTSDPVRPGFSSNVWLSVRNVGTMPSPADVQFTFDAARTYVSSSIVPDQLNANVAEWNLPLLAPDAIWQAEVVLHTPGSVAIGTPINEQISAMPDQPDQTPEDNVILLGSVVVGSYDPNDKTVVPLLLSPQEVSDGERVEYTIRFQNTGTAAAERVVITDTLSNGLQWATMRPVASSHAHHWFIHGGVLHMFFENINLPDSTSDEPGSHGFVKFSFVPSAALMLGESVGNIANIYFDFNEPVITNEAVFTVETSTAMTQLGDAARGGVQVWPNPVEDVLRIGSDIRGHVDVVDVTGRVVLRDRMAAATHLLDVRTLAPGRYTVRIAGGGVRPFIKR